MVKTEGIRSVNVARQTKGKCIMQRYTRPQYKTNQLCLIIPKEYQLRTAKLRDHTLFFAKRILRMYYDQQWFDMTEKISKACFPVT